MKNIYLLIILTAIFFFGSCSPSNHVVVDQPVAPVYIKPATPGPDYVWLDGDWEWQDDKYVFANGHWEKPKANRTWVTGSWVKTGKGYYWKKGYWQ